MAIWILTIGSNDVQLEHEDNWQKHFRKVKKELKNDFGSSEFKLKDKEHANNRTTFTVAARVLGISYGKDKIENYDDLVFPLLDSFSLRLKQEEEPVNRVICLLTDQLDYFSFGKRQDPQCPFWQDTIELQPILEKYFRHNLPKIETTYITLKPQGTVGLDDWSSVLSLVQSELATVSVGDREPIYVSHQAGTPAISSAVQFVSLSRFGDRIKFLVSNEFSTEPAAIIEGSKYLEGIQIQQAKKLITAGSPGAAQKLIADNKGLTITIRDSQKQKLDELVDIFNITNPGNKQEDFEVKVAITRVVRALELIEIYFKNRNYIQGIALLSAAQETFMKAAIKYKLEETDRDEKGELNFKILDYIKWTNEGLLFIDNMRDEKNKKQYTVNYSAFGSKPRQKVKVKRDILDKIHFPIEKIVNDNDYIQFKYMSNNSALYQWLSNLYGEAIFEDLKLLKWLAKHKRPFEDDKRNQLMHNLRGVDKTEVIKYFFGDDCTTFAEVIDMNLEDPVLNTYQKYVRKPLRKAIDDCKLPYEEISLNQELIDLANGLDS